MTIFMYIGRRINAINTPARLKITWATAARFADIVVFMLASIAVIQVPILVPNTRGIAALISINPAAASAIMIPVVTLLLCTIAVAIIPIKTANNGLWLRVRNKLATIPPSVLRGLIAFVIIFKPKNMVPKPKIVSPMSLYFLFLPKK